MLLRGLHRTKAFFTPPPTENEAGGAQAAVRGHSRDSWPQLIQGMSQTIQSPADHLNQEECGPGAAAQEKIGHQSVGGEQLFFICITYFSWGLLLPFVIFISIY